MRLLVPMAYLYIAMMVMRDISRAWPAFHDFIQTYLPRLNNVIERMQRSSKFVEVWVVIEALFYILQHWHIQYLQYKDPLEASLTAAPILTLEKRRELFNRVIEHVYSHDPVDFLRGWFFDEPLENITRYDVYDYLTWSMFEGRNQEHLTRDEIDQLHWMVRELEYCFSIHLYGVDENAMENIEKERYFVRYKRVQKHEGRTGTRMRRVDSVNFKMLDLFENPSTGNNSGHSTDSEHSDSNSDGKTSDDESRDVGVALKWEIDPSKRLKPSRKYKFLDTMHDESPSFFTNLYENYKKRHSQIQKLENFASRLRKAEENAKGAASSLAENAYSKLVNRGSDFDKRLNAMSDAMQNQLHEAWNSVSKVKERLETAQFITSRKRALHMQLNGYRMLLEKAINSNSVPPKQMVDLMHKITQCNENIDAIENSASTAFLQSMGLDMNQLLQRRDPNRYAKYTGDPLLGLAVYPLMFQLAILGLTDGLLRVLLRSRGFERLHIGSTVYYYHPGFAQEGDEEGVDIADDDGENNSNHIIPIVFCHGIGVGLIYYMSLIDELLKLGHPLFLPEIPYVTGFRPWISRQSILTPHAAVATLTAMLASHGYLKATFIGHSYGTSWLSYMCKYSPDSIAAVQFLDPIVFCLHIPCLTKSFVYSQSDPGSISYFVRTDVIINWTIQRSFPWSRIVLFAEDIPSNIPCSIYISENDILIPVDAVTGYLKSKRANIKNLDDVDAEHFSSGPMNVTIIRGQQHGDFASCPKTCSILAENARVLAEQAMCGKGDL